MSTNPPNSIDTENIIALSIILGGALLAGVGALIAFIVSRSSGRANGEAHNNPPQNPPDGQRLGQIQ